MILSIKDEFLLEKEEDMPRFLGIEIMRDSENNTITVTQNGLIDRILVAMDMEYWNLKYIPVEKYPLYKDETGVPCC